MLQLPTELIPQIWNYGDGLVMEMISPALTWTTPCFDFNEGFQNHPFA